MRIGSRKLLVALSFFSFFISSCRKDKNYTKDEIVQYISIGHTRTNINPQIYLGFNRSLLDTYDLIMLGGDMCQLTSLDTLTMDSLESVINISSENVLWALGNHDYSNLDLISGYTGRPPYYAHYQDNSTFIVLDTQDSLSNIIGDQKLLLNNVLDTINQSKNLFVLSHKLIWMRDHPELDDQIDGISNGIKGDCFHCVNENNFYSDIYPKLVSLQNKGTNVYCVGGDLGFKTSAFSYITSDEITFLGSGLDYQKDEFYNQVLIFTYNKTQHSMRYEFIPVAQM